jgi:hypothetical protein
MPASLFYHGFRDADNSQEQKAVPVGFQITELKYNSIACKLYTQSGKEKMSTTTWFHLKFVMEDDSA